LKYKERKLEKIEGNNSRDKGEYETLHDAF